MTRRNIFHVDIDAVRQILIEANAAIANRSRDLLDALDRVPPSLQSDDDFKRALAYSRMLKDQVKECRESRLSDQKSFRLATKAVDEYFAEFEKPLKSALEKVAKIIARSLASKSAPTSQPVAPIPVVKSESGITVATSTPAAVASEDLASPISLQWIVTSVNRKNVDLEALRPYLTDTAIKQAANRHLLEHGPNALKGVAYEQIAIA